MRSLLSCWQACCRALATKWREAQCYPFFRRRSRRLARTHRRYCRRLDHHRRLLQATVRGALRRAWAQAHDGARRPFFRRAAFPLSAHPRSMVPAGAPFRTWLRYRDLLSRRLGLRCGSWRDRAGRSARLVLVRKRRRRNCGAARRRLRALFFTASYSVTYLLVGALGVLTLLVVLLLPDADRPVSDTKTLSARTMEFRQGLAEVLRTPPIFVAAPSCTSAMGRFSDSFQIGRASCRERV